MAWTRGDDDSSAGRLPEFLEERLRICGLGKGKEMECSDRHGAKTSLLYNLGVGGKIKY